MRKPHETFQAEGTPGTNGPEMTSQRSWSGVCESGQRWEKRGKE